MARKKFTDEMKAAFMTAVHKYMDKGWSAGSAYKQVAAEYQQEGKDVPEKSHFYRWLEREKRESANLDGPDGQVGLVGRRGNRSGDPRGTDVENAETEEAARDPEDNAEPTGPGEPEPEGPEGPPGETPELDDYTRRLELMVRLYRTRSEAAVDAVCDRLLPELAGEESE